MMKNLTPEHLRSKCAMMASCPGVYQDENGDLIIVGKHVLGREANVHGIPVAIDEEAVRIPMAYFANLALAKCVEEDLV
jgi:hypothetical protein